MGKGGRVTDRYIAPYTVWTGTVTTFEHSYHASQRARVIEVGHMASIRALFSVEVEDHDRTGWTQTDDSAIIHEAFGRCIEKMRRQAGRTTKAKGAR